MGRQSVTEYTCHGVTWATGVATLLLADTKTQRLAHVELTGQRLGFHVTSPMRCCTGRYGFVDAYAVEPLSCPGQAEVATGDQCAACAARDEFRFAHRFHQGGYVPAALRTYMAQPHWLYLATFAHAVSKVGTAAGPRKTSRLNEQGPIRATYLAKVPDGRIVRQLEDTLSTRLGIPQTVRAAAKLAALVNPDISRAEAAHDKLIQQATAQLAELSQTPVNEAWSPPADSQILRQPPRQHQRAIYPHDLWTGEHGFHIESCLGATALVRLGDDPSPDTIRYVVDLNGLKGARIILGDFASPATETQTTLF